MGESRTVEVEVEPVIEDNELNDSIKKKKKKTVELIIGGWS